MKKTYIRPEANLICFHIERSVLMNVSASENTIQSDDWSNEREWNNNSSSAWGDAESEVE